MAQVNRTYKFTIFYNKINIKHSKRDPAKVDHSSHNVDSRFKILYFAPFISLTTANKENVKDVYVES